MASVQAVPSKFKTKEFIERLTTAARKSQSMMPTADELKTLDKPTKALFERISALLEDVLSTTEWTDANLRALAKETGWVHTSIGLALRPADRPGGGSPTSTDCENVYSSCMKTHGCTYSLLCLCCIPCSIEYAGCMRRIITKFGGVSVGTPVTTGGTQTRHSTP